MDLRAVSQQKGNPNGLEKFQFKNVHKCHLTYFHAKLKQFLISITYHLFTLSLVYSATVYKINIYQQRLQNAAHNSMK